MMQLSVTSKLDLCPNGSEIILTAAPDLSKVCRLSSDDTGEVIAFLARKPVHTVAMVSMIVDNGIESPLNRGKFVGYRNAGGELEGVALIGHTTLVEARSDESLKAFAFAARSSTTPIHMIMSSDDNAERFFNYYGSGSLLPRLVCTELLFATSFPFPVQDCEWEVKTAEPNQINEIARAHAEVAFIESGVDPMSRDPKGYMERVMRRIEKGRTFVVYDGDTLVFKADIISEASDVIYLEGIWVSPEYRGRGYAAKCLAKLSLHLLERASTISLLSNVDFPHAHRSFIKAGYQEQGSCTTIFL
ncbi:MAG TPA: GNAT family N-acetyltransferase [Pyrinomonadaceae bacterium]|nr:GNAT family N-acetyltransferase [Pyrinomonadaceae bacterium]HMP66385.1 GNAT family N-acetyltransferase [Pyrinomonadaceae bacterium]